MVAALLAALATSTAAAQNRRVLAMLEMPNETGTAVLLEPVECVSWIRNVGTEDVRISGAGGGESGLEFRLQGGVWTVCPGIDMSHLARWELPLAAGETKRLYADFGFCVSGFPEAARDHPNEVELRAIVLLTSGEKFTSSARRLRREIPTGLDSEAYRYIDSRPADYPSALLDRYAASLYAAPFLLGRDGLVRTVPGTVYYDDLGKPAFRPVRASFAQRVSNEARSFDPSDRSAVARRRDRERLLVAWLERNGSRRSLGPRVLAELAVLQAAGGETEAFMVTATRVQLESTDPELRAEVAAFVADALRMPPRGQ